MSGVDEVHGLHSGIYHDRRCPSGACVPSRSRRPPPRRTRRPRAWRGRSVRGRPSRARGRSRTRAPRTSSTGPCTRRGGRRGPARRRRSTCWGAVIISPIVQITTVPAMASPVWQNAIAPKPQAMKRPPTKRLFPWDQCDVLRFSRTSNSTISAVLIVNIQPKNDAGRPRSRTTSSGSAPSCWKNTAAIGTHAARKTKSCRSV